MTADSRTVSFDARPLVDPVDAAAVRAFVRQARAEGRIPPLFAGGTIVIAIIVGVAFVVIFGVVATTMFATLAAAVSTSGSFAPPIVFIPFLVIAAVLVLVVVGIVRGWLGSGQRWYRLDGFARANGMTFVPHVSGPSLPGMIFGIGDARAATDLVRGDRPRFVEFANYAYRTGSGKNRSTHRWGYVAVKLDVPLPHIVLDALSNNTLFGSNLPASFDQHQRLSLEGDFDRHFALYCPEGYEADALYLFTPDIMARFIDNAAALDVEIVDDWLFLYAKREFSTLDPATWAWLFSVVAALLDKLAQWSRWRDDRLAASVAPTRGTDAASAPFAAPSALLTPPPGVARAGLRLRRRTPWVAWIVVGAFVLFWLLTQANLLRW